MRRILVRRPGGHEALELVEGPDPKAGSGQVRLRVKAAGVNFADTIARLGYYEAAKGRYPLTPGFEFAGVVDQAGSGVKSFREGDKVFGITLFGAYASSIVVSPEQLWPCPEGWDFPDCAAFPAVFLTAYYGLFKAARVESGETALIHSAAGGAGGAILQLSRIAGLKTVAVVGSAAKTALCREMGADAVIDRSSQDLWGEAGRLAPGGFDAIFDANGLTTLRQGFEHLAPGGRLVVYGFAELLPRGAAHVGFLRLAFNYLRVPKFSPLEMTTTNRAVMGFNVAFLFHRLDLARQAMTRMLGWVEEGKIRKAPVALFPIERTSDAHAAIESGNTVGKLVLTF